jgi:hypothetical protein
MLSVNCFAQQDSINNLETVAFQKKIISKLTGIEPIDGKDEFLLQRSSPKERKLTTDYLVAQLNKIGLKAEKQNYVTTNSNIFLDLFYAPVKGVNIVAQLSSTIPSSKYVILGAHYDTERTSPGAIDNATGIALILDVVKKMTHLKVRNANFIVVFFDQEEDNEVGSRQFVKMLNEADNEIQSVHIFDLIGWDSNRNRKISLQSPPAFLETAYQNNAVDLGISIQIVGGASSDNKSFIKEGYKTVLISDEVEDVTPHYHTSKDDISTVDFEYLALISKLVYKTLQTIANE